MEPRQSGQDLMEGPEGGGLRELAMKWFTETQASLILHNGNFPDWFQGFTTRKDAEDKLNDKTLGCFLIRLSDKAIGYILSYKGQDRCRHFVINQNPAGLFIISGDSQTHLSLTDLIEHYKVSPIQPFGEYLTSCCYEPNTGELYDVVQFEAKDNPGLSVKALRNLWDQKNHQKNEQRNDQKGYQWTDKSTDQKSDQGIDQWNEAQAGTLPPPELPPKPADRKLTGTASVYSNIRFDSQDVPPVPKRGKPQSHSLSGSLQDKSFSSTHSQAPPTYPDPDYKVDRRARMGSLNQVKVDQRNSSTSWREEAPPLSLNSAESSYHRGASSTATAPGVTYSELGFGDGRSRSLPRLDDCMEVESSSKLSSTPSGFTTSSHSPNPPKRVTCQTYSLHEPSGNNWRTPSSDVPGFGQDQFSLNPLYSTPQQEDSMYAAVPNESHLNRHVVDETYEQIPEDGGRSRPQSTDATYETLEDLKPKHSKFTWGKSNAKWRKFLPEYKKK